jgi:hypothetical protein
MKEKPSTESCLPSYTQTEKKPLIKQWREGRLKRKVYDEKMLAKWEADREKEPKFEKMMAKWKAK